MEHTFTAPLWRWPGDGAWHFVSLPEAVADELDDSPLPRRGFGSLRVRVTIGGTTWSTSVFPDRARRTFILPVKKQVRDREGLLDGDPVEVTLQPLESE